MAFGLAIRLRMKYSQVMDFVKKQKIIQKVAEELENYRTELLNSPIGHLDRQQIDKFAKDAVLNLQFAITRLGNIHELLALKKTKDEAADNPEV